MSDTIRNILRSLFKAPTEDGKGTLGLVLPGGGARAAYQAGLLRGFAEQFPGVAPRVITGVSAGAVNASFLGSHATEPLVQSTSALSDLWHSLESNSIFRLDRPNLFRVVRHLIRDNEPMDSPARGGILDTTPFYEFLESHLGPVDKPIENVARAIEQGCLDSLAITATSYATGESVTWLEGNGVETWDRTHRRTVYTRIRPEHVLASAALPIFFSAVKVKGDQLGDGWYGDGGIRQTAPLSPALNLGADKILAINTRVYQGLANKPGPVRYPSPAHVLAILLNAVFLDTIDREAAVIKRINKLLRKTPRRHWGTFRPIDLLVIRPTRDLAKLAGDFEPTLPGTVRFALRGVGVDASRSPEWLSMLLFHRTYIKQLVALGEEDALFYADDFEAFLSDDAAGI